MRTIRDGWAIDDQYPDSALSEIDKVSDRAHSLLVRKADPELTNDGVLRITGAIRMIAGLEYHHENFMAIYGGIQCGEPGERDHLVHETIAYLGRLGQFAAFAKSEYARPAIEDFGAIAPTINRLLFFRNKYAAHRSLDAPRDDALETQIAHEIGMRASLFQQRPGGKQVKIDCSVPFDEVAFESELFRNSYLNFQMRNDDAETWELFSPEMDHAVVMSEAYTVIEKVISYRP